MNGKSDCWGYIPENCTLEGTGFFSPLELITLCESLANEDPPAANKNNSNQGLGDMYVYQIFGHCQSKTTLLNENCTYYPFLIFCCCLESDGL